MRARWLRNRWWPQYARCHHKTGRGVGDRPQQLDAQAAHGAVMQRIARHLVPTSGLTSASGLSWGLVPAIFWWLSMRRCAFISRSDRRSIDTRQNACPEYRSGRCEQDPLLALTTSGGVRPAGQPRGGRLTPAATARSRRRRTLRS